MSEITATYDSLMNQAESTAKSYFNVAIDYIDRCFGEGYAKGHPELIAAFMNACVKDYTASSTAKSNQYIADTIIEFMRLREK